MPDAAKQHTRTPHHSLITGKISAAEVEQCASVLWKEDKEGMLPLHWVCDRGFESGRERILKLAAKWASKCVVL